MITVYFCLHKINIAIGLFLLLIWKIATTIHDRLEYAKFLRDRDLAKWDRVSRSFTLIYEKEFVKDKCLCFQNELLAGRQSHLQTTNDRLYESCVFK